MKLCTNRLLPLLLLLSAMLAPAVQSQELGAVITTSKGVIEVQLHERIAPTSAANFVNLALRGFYDGLTFHRVERNFMIQGGDHLGTGAGDPGYRFSGELTLRHNRAGVLATANKGVGTDGSQFFITHIPVPHLDGKHSVFGQVTKGQDVVNAIGRGDAIVSITITGDIASLWRRKRTDLARWNQILDENFPHLKPAPAPAAE